MYYTDELDLFDRRELRENRSPKKPAWKEEGFVKKVIVGQQGAAQSIEGRLPEDGCPGAWNNHVSYSLKKKGRRELLVEELRSNIQAWNEHLFDAKTNDDLLPVVTGLEKRLVHVRRHKPRPNKGLAFHGMERDDNGELAPVHRYPNGVYGNESTLTQKPKGPKPKKAPKPRRRANDRRPANPTNEEDLNNATEQNPRLQYEITTIKDQHLYKLDCLQYQKKYNWTKRPSHHRRNHAATGQQMLNEYLDQNQDQDQDFDYSEPEEEIVEIEPKIELQDAQVTESEDKSSNDSIDFLLDADQKTEESQPEERIPGSLSVNLVDLAFLQCIQAQAHSQKRLQRQRQGRRRFHTETSVTLYSQKFEEDDSAGPSGISRALSDSEEPSNDAPTVTRGGLMSDDYFQIIPNEVLCTGESIGESYLHQIYGEAYYECSCVPRRFVIDISAPVKTLLQSIYGDDCPKLDIDMKCVCEVVPPTVLVALLDEDERSSVTPMKVWMNGSFGRNVRCVYVDTINPCMPHTLEEVVESVVKMAGTLPMEYYHQNLELPRSENSIQQAPARLIANTSAVCLDRSTATTEILEEQNMIKKLQRQITAVKRYDWFNNVNESVCGICLDWPVEEIGFCLSECRHWFCNKCWRQYCTERILNGWGSLTCPYPKCTTAVDYYTLTTFVPLPVCKTYSEQLRDQCIGKNSKQWAWCPNARCGRLIKLHEGQPNTSLTCVCGYFWCKKCSGASHWPASCEHAELYVKKLKERQDDPTLLEPGVLLEKKELAVEVKKCPHCKILMEKGEGCICMTCRCGKLFCWACGGAWQDTNHSSCYAKKAITGFLHVRLIDVGKEQAGELREFCYERALAHRMATRSPYTTKLRQAMLSKCWKTPRRIQRLVLSSLPCGQQTSPIKDMAITEQRLQRQMMAVASHVQRFMEIQRQAHYLLEFIYVHLQYSLKRRSWAQLEGVKFAVDRLEFALDRMEEACKSGDLRKVDEFMERVKSLLQTSIKEIWSIKF